MNPYASIAYLFFKTVRSPQYRTVYYLIGQLELYEYQKINYDGAMKRVLDTKKEMDQNLKDMLHIDFIEDKVTSILPPLQNYNSFTNPKFLNEERVDVLLVKNTLLELAVISIIKLLIFFLLNRLFYCLFNFQISRFFRTYSFKIFLL